MARGVECCGACCAGPGNAAGAFVPALFIPIGCRRPASSLASRARADQPPDHSLVQTAGAAWLSGGAQTPRERGFGERAVIVRVCAGFWLGAGAGCAQQRRVSQRPHEPAMHWQRTRHYLLSMTDWAMSTMRCTSSAVWQRPCPIVALEWISCAPSTLSLSGSRAKAGPSRRVARVGAQSDDAQHAIAQRQLREHARQRSARGQSGSR